MDNTMATLMYQLITQIEAVMNEAAKQDMALRSIEVMRELGETLEDDFKEVA